MWADPDASLGHLGGWQSPHGAALGGRRGTPPQRQGRSSLSSAPAPDWRRSGRRCDVRQPRSRPRSRRQPRGSSTRGRRRRRSTSGGPPPQSSGRACRPPLGPPLALPRPSLGPPSALPWPGLLTMRCELMPLCPSPQGFPEEPDGEGQMAGEPGWEDPLRASQSSTHSARLVLALGQPSKEALELRLPAGAGLEASAGHSPPPVVR
jgi:hypothetical protein